MNTYLCVECLNKSNCIVHSLYEFLTYRYFENHYWQLCKSTPWSKLTRSPWTVKLSWQHSC